MMIGPTREDSKVVSQGELWKLWNQDLNQPCWASLSRLLPSFLAVSAIVSLSFSFDSVSLFSLFQFQSLSFFLPSPSSATLSLFPTFFCLLFFSLFNSSLSFL